MTNSANTNNNYHLPLEPFCSVDQKPCAICTNNHPIHTVPSIVSCRSLLWFCLFLVLQCARVRP